MAFPEKPVKLSFCIVINKLAAGKKTGLFDSTSNKSKTGCYWLPVTEQGFFYEEACTPCHGLKGEQTLLLQLRLLTAT